MMIPCYSSHDRLRQLRVCVQPNVQLSLSGPCISVPVISGFLLYLSGPTPPCRGQAMACTKQLLSLHLVERVVWLWTYRHQSHDQAYKRVSQGVHVSCRKGSPHGYRLE